MMDAALNLLYVFLAFSVVTLLGAIAIIFIDKNFNTPNQKEKWK